MKYISINLYFTYKKLTYILNTKYYLIIEIQNKNIILYMTVYLI